MSHFKLNRDLFSFDVTSFTEQKGCDMNGV